jgi:endo-1,4-beta-D-glucanase Y
MVKWPRKKVLALTLIVLVYVAFGITIKLLVMSGMIPQAIVPIEDDSPQLNPDAQRVQVHLNAAIDFFNANLVDENNHVFLYYVENTTIDRYDNTNSEALSYYLQWNAQAGNKQEFDTTLDYMEEFMIHPLTGHLMWRLEPDGSIVDDGGNIAPDAELRVIFALLIAEKKWGDRRYTELINTLTDALENMAITSDGLLSAYGGLAGEDIWKTEEVWLSYADFQVFESLAQRRGEPWITMQKKMKEATINAQIHNGLYNSQLTEDRDYGNGMDGDGYSINSLWMMVRAAESLDPELKASARKSLEFYMKQYEEHGRISAIYSSSGDAMTDDDPAWVYALVGRAAVALGDHSFSRDMMDELIGKQISDEESYLYGAIPEGSSSGIAIGQFTMQESIITLHNYVENGRMNT